MPFDRLVSHNLKTPEFHPYIAPPRPVIPWAQYIVPAVDKIAQSMIYSFSPYERQMRGAELAKARIGMMQANQQMTLAPQEMKLREREMSAREQQLNFQDEMRRRYPSGDSSVPVVPNQNGSGFHFATPSEQEKLINSKQRTGEANDAVNYGSVAEQFRKAHGVQPQEPTDDDEDFWLKYHAASAKHGEGNFGYDADGNPVANDENE